MLKLLIKHRLPRKIRYAKVYFQAGSASVSLSIDGASADWHARIGRARNGVVMSDKEYARLRQAVPVKELLDDDGEDIVVRNKSGEEERWTKPRWVLRDVHHKGNAED